ncbi:hypothetical protein [Shimia biformata]|uniref:hypothetical protein n=1 Tax=Shimia biformata TaxID=1294299 RepID=UPI0019522109|nr:hypothetical protein [Shimia biformata]
MKQALILCALGVLPVIAVAESREDWRTSGPWQIIVDPAVGRGCLMETVMADGTKVRVGVLPQEDGGYIAALNRDWTGIEPNKSGIARFDFGRDLFEGETRSVIEGDWRGGSAFFNNPEFLENFEQGRALTIAGSGGIQFEISLTGTRRAVAEVLKCQEEQDRQVAE